MTKKVVWTIIAVAAAALIGFVLFLFRAHRVREIAERLAVPIEGAVIQREADPQKELPIADVVITATDGIRSAATRSDASGYFKLVLHKRVLSDPPITVTFQHPRYQPLEMTVQTGRLETPNQLYVAAMVPLRSNSSKSPCWPQPSGSAGLQYPGKVYAQHPHPDECGRAQSEPSRWSTREMCPAITSLPVHPMGNGRQPL